MGRVYILGSGFSADAGLPLSRDILKIIFKNPSHNSEVFQLKKWLEENFYRNEPNWINHNNFSEILSRIDLIRYYKPIQQVNYQELDRFEDFLIKLFINVLANNSLSIPEPFRKFASGISSQDTIITFNQDLIIELALKQAGRRYNYLYGGKSSGSNIPLLKLHGSVNLTFCPQCHLIAKAIAVVCPQCHIPMKPLIIAPTFFKSYQIPAIRSLWFAALKNLSQAQELFFIGYSMPNDDLLSHQLFDFGYRLNPRAPVTVINGPRPSLAIFQNIYQQGINNSQLKFVEYMKKL